MGRGCGAVARSRERGAAARVPERPRDNHRPASAAIRREARAAHATRAGRRAGEARVGRPRAATASPVHHCTAQQPGPAGARLGSALRDSQRRGARTLPAARGARAGSGGIAGAASGA